MRLTPVLAVRQNIYPVKGKGLAVHGGKTAWIAGGGSVATVSVVPPEPRIAGFDQMSVVMVRRAQAHAHQATIATPVLWRGRFRSAGYRSSEQPCCRAGGYL